MSEPPAPEWMQRPEGGGRFGLWFMRQLALHVGRKPTRLVLVFVAAYYVVRRGPERRASRAYLTRAFGRPATLWDVYRHMLTFAITTLDRVFLLTDAFRRFSITTHGLEELHRVLDLREGALLVGAHHGSFDALRVLALQRPDQQVRPVIDLEQNPTASRLLNTLNPQIARSIINARQDGMTTALAIHEALRERALVTLLADRARPGNALVRVPFLGEPAGFPAAPWLLAAALKVPVVLCFGLYRGGDRYELYFEAFADKVDLPHRGREAALKAVIERFALRLEQHVRLAPLNWFNFFDFWA